MKVAALQMVSGPRLADNLASAASLIEQAAHAGAELLVLPEYFCLMGQRDADKLEIREPFGDGPIQSFLSKQAIKHSVWIVAGTIPLQAGQQERVFNSDLVFDPEGKCVARYDKIHLFRFDNGVEKYDESRVLEAGSKPSLFTLPSRDGQHWSIGLSVCYDLRFPELYRNYSRAGAHLLLVPAAFTYTTGKAHWEVLLRARAIENLCFVGAAAQGGQHANGRRTWGQSIWIDPWGEVLNQLAAESGVVLADLDAALLNEKRAQLPSLQHRTIGV